MLQFFISYSNYFIIFKSIISNELISIGRKKEYPNIRTKPCFFCYAAFMDIKSNTILTTWIVFPHHLSGKWQHLANVSHVFLTEEYLFFNQYRFHKQKLVFHRASMKAYEQFLKEKNLAITPNPVQGNLKTSYASDR